MQAMIAGLYMGLMTSILIIAIFNPVLNPRDPKPNACFWFLMVICPPLGVVYLIVRHGVIPLCAALRRDAPAFFRFTA